MDDGKGDGEHVMKGQMYVEKLSPFGGVKHPWPLVFIQGAGQTGTVSFRFVLCLRRFLKGYLSCHFKKYLRTEWAREKINFGGIV